MSVQWTGLSRQVFAGSGDLIHERATRLLPCSIEITQLYNGRIAVEVHLALENSKQDWYRCYESFELSGMLDDGSRLNATGVVIDTSTIHSRDGSVSLKCYILNPGYLEIIHQDNIKGSCPKVICEVTNLPLYRSRTYEATTERAQLQFLQLSDYKITTRLMNALRTGGVLSQIAIEFLQPSFYKETDEFIHMLCRLLSLSQRAHVWCVGQHWVDGSKSVVRSRYQEPMFYFSRPSRPLIPLTALVKFVEDTIDTYDDKCHEWSFGEAQDLYVQAMSIHSVWPQSLGFFTALEMLKSTFLRQHGDESQYYVTPDKEFDNEFKRKRVAHRVIEVLGDAFDAFSCLAGNDKAALKFKIRKELNRRPYRLVLNSMFQELGMVVDEDDLKWLVKIRNQIIHRGSPQYGGREPWADKSSEAVRWVGRFASLVERTFMAILGYEGQFEQYDQSFIPIEE